MIQVKMPSNNLKERKYVVSVLLEEFLGLDYKVIPVDDSYDSWEVILKNGNKLIIQDHFFSNFPKDLAYLNEENIPKKVEFGSNDFIAENDIPIIYGSDEMKISRDGKLIECGIDIFASSFFMLTRWEEYVNKTRDRHNRFPAIASAAFKNNFLDRPVVNEYVEMVWNMLRFLGCKQARKKKDFKLVLTHDVDEIQFWKNWGQLFKIMAGDIIKRKDLLLAFERLAEYFLIKRGKINDPFNTFEWLMDKSEAIGVKSRFYFMSGGVTHYDNRYDIKEQKSFIEKIKKRGHIVGIHPSYNAYNNFEQFKQEKELLEKVCECQITEGREHYLRFEVPTTWQIWEDNGMQVDSTCGYADKEGFRCGTGDEFSVFNILSGKMLHLKERPLIFMDGRDFECGGFRDASLFNHNLFLYIDLAKKYNMQLAVLFHNSIFVSKRKYMDDFKRVINLCAE